VNDRYGGTGEVRGKKTGYFHTQKIDGRWWLIDPDGGAFFAVGTTRIGYGTDWNKNELSNYDASVLERYDTESKWIAHMVRRLRSWRFNYFSGAGRKGEWPKDVAMTTSCGSTWAFRGKTQQLTSPGVPGWQTLVDVFDPAWERSYADVCAKTAEVHARQRNLIGYYTDNELFWGVGNAPGQSMLDAILFQHRSIFSKQELVRWLRERYCDDLGALGNNWGIKLGAWDELMDVKSLDALNARVLADKSAFLFHFARRYFRTVDMTLKKADPHHMNLGCRVHGWCDPEVVRAMGEFVDVVSYNKYDNDAPSYQIEELFAKEGGKPVLVSEWGFRSMDAGLPNVGGVGRIVPTQKMRGEKYAAFLEGCARTPSCVGVCFYSYVDDPAGGGGGIMGNENSNYGIVNKLDEPYAVFAKRIAKANARVYAWHREGKRPAEAITIAVPRDFQWQPVSDFFVQRNGKVEGQHHLRAFLRGKEAGVDHQSQTFRMDFAKPVRFSAWVYEVEDHPILEIVLDGGAITTFDLPSGDKLGLVSYRMPNGWHTVYDREYGIDVPAGEHTVTVVNRGTGWIWLNSYKCAGEIASRR
jgi:agarase